MRDIWKRFKELDTFTQEQISRDTEFRAIFPEKHLQQLDCTSVDYFPTRHFNFNEFFGAWYLVLSIIGVIGYIFK